MRPPARLAVCAAAFVAAAAMTAAAASPSGEAATVTQQAWRVDPPDPAPPLGDRAEAVLIDLVNGVRRDRGLAEVRSEARVTAAAAAQASYMASIGSLTHVGAGGSDAGDRLRAAGFTWGSWGEDIGAGFVDPGTLVDAWMASPDHRRELLGDFDSVGAGVAASGDGTLYWALVLATGS